MLGMNVFEFNKATMMEAVQFYLASKLKEPLPVTDIESQTRGYSNEIVYRVTVMNDGPETKKEG